MMLPYDAAFDPPAIIVSMTVAESIRRRPQVECAALINTGAEITAVPQLLLLKRAE